MLAKKNRLNLSKSDNKKLLSLGKKINTLHFFIRYKKELPKDAQISVLISKKVLKKAIERNKYRRRIYSLLRKCGFLNLDNIKMIINVKKINSLSQQEMENELLDVKKTIVKGERSEK